MIAPPEAVWVGEGISNGKAESEFKLSARRVLELATIEGARSMGIGDKTGSLKPGKRADHGVDVGGQSRCVRRPCRHAGDGGPAGQCRHTVMVDGRILKRGGRLISSRRGTDCARGRRGQAELRNRANWC
jgi:5-methylthioadenosine/S-adenosylhomocysteine deaminase